MSRRTTHSPTRGAPRGRALASLASAAILLGAGTAFAQASDGDADAAAGRTRATPASGASSPTAPGLPGTADGDPSPTPGANAATAAATSTRGPEDGSGTTSPTRALPDYDGRGAPETTAGDLALWAPRVVLFPAYVVSEYVLRRPLGWFLTTAERNQWPSVLRDLFLFGPEKKAGIVPTFFLDFGARPSLGLYAFWDDLLGKGNHLRLHASTFGTDWLQGAVADRFPLGKDATLDLRLEGSHRPDWIFHGLGPRSRDDLRARFGMDRVVARPVLEMSWWRGSRLTVEGGVKAVQFRDATCCDSPSVDTRVRQGELEAPPLFREGYTSVYQRGELTIDSREARPADQTGMRLELEVEQGSNVRRAQDNWVRYGGSVGGFLDLKNNRTVSLSVTGLFVDPISSSSRAGAQIPFTEQIVLGGSGPMRGFLYGRLVDRSATVATLKYKWPIWVFLDGSMQASLGNVFGPQLDGFKPSLLRFSGSVGVESVGGADHTFEILTGVGTETFDDNLRVSSFRLLFGTNRGF